MTKSSLVNWTNSQLEKEKSNEHWYVVTYPPMLRSILATALYTCSLRSGTASTYRKKKSCALKPASNEAP